MLCAAAPPHLAEATWAADGKSVRWHSGHATAQMNVENVSYTVVYLYQA